MVSLDNLSKGESATITEIKGYTALRCRILQAGLTPGTQVQVIRNAPRVDLLTRGSHIILGPIEAASIMVERIEGDELNECKRKTNGCYEGPQQD